MTAIVEGLGEKVLPLSEATRARFMENGFLILREVIPHSMLNPLREQFETLVERQKVIWAKERKPDDPPGGEWETSRFPSPEYQGLIDEHTAATAELCLHENTRGVSRELMSAEEAAVHQMSLFCNPVSDHGPGEWHRDVKPQNVAPLAGLQADMTENAPAYLQWNIPLYDDSIFWVVPGSHRRPNTGGENMQFQSDARAPMPESMPIELGAGDGVVYSHFILHWGSNYSTNLRRTIMTGFDSLGGPNFLHLHHFYWDLDFTKHLPEAARGCFDRFVELHVRRFDVVETTARAIIKRDSARFREGLAALHPGEKGRMIGVVLLSKLAGHIKKLKDPAVVGLPHAERANAVLVNPATLHFLEAFAGRYSSNDANILCRRFAELATRLEGSLIDMPADFEVDDFIASWDD